MGKGKPNKLLRFNTTNFIFFIYQHYSTQILFASSFKCLRKVDVLVLAVTMLRQIYVIYVIRSQHKIINFDWTIGSSGYPAFLVKCVIFITHLTSTSNSFIRI